MFIILLHENVHEHGHGHGQGHVDGHRQSHGHVRQEVPKNVFMAYTSPLRSPKAQMLLN
jgi:hypothetical protein